MTRIMTIALVIAALFAGLMMAQAWQHNSQCEIHCDGIIHWGYWLALGGTWFVLTFVVVIVIGSLVQMIRGKTV